MRSEDKRGHGLPRLLRRRCWYSWDPLSLATPSAFFLAYVRCQHDLNLSRLRRWWGNEPDNSGWLHLEVPLYASNYHLGCWHRSLRPSLSLPLPIYIHVQQSSIPWYLHRHPSILWSTYSHNIHFIRIHKYTIIQSKKNQRNLCHIWIHVAVATVNTCWSTGIIHTIVYMHIDGYDMGLAEIGDYISGGGWLSISYNFGPGGLPTFLDNPTSFLYPLYPRARPVLTHFFRWVF